MKKFRYDIIKDHKLYELFTPVIILINKLNYKSTYIGTENVPQSGALIVAVNHVHSLDPFVAAVGILPRSVHFMSKKELFCNSFAQWFLTNMNSFPVDRKKADINTIKHSIAILKSGLVLGIFPEGTRSTTRDFLPAKNGAVFLASKTKSDILPTSLYYSDSVKPKKLTVRYGKPIKFSELNLPDKPSKEQMKAATDYVMSKIRELYDLGHDI